MLTTHFRRVINWCRLYCPRPGENGNLCWWATKRIREWESLILILWNMTAPELVGTNGKINCREEELCFVDYHVIRLLNNIRLDSPGQWSNPLKFFHFPLLAGCWQICSQIHKREFTSTHHPGEHVIERDADFQIIDWFVLNGQAPTLGRQH